MKITKGDFITITTMAKNEYKGEFQSASEVGLVITSNNGDREVWFGAIESILISPIKTVQGIGI